MTSIMKPMMNQPTQSSSYALRVVLVLAVFGGLAISLKNLAIAQPQPPTVPIGAVQPYPYRTNYSGQVEHYLLNHQGQVSGLILSNGIQVRFPPSSANSLVAAIKPGDRVTLTGTPSTPSNFGQVVRAYSITNTNTQRTVVNQPLAYPPTPPTAVNYSNLSVAGTARHWLVGRRGEINGVLLSSGAQVMFPPQVDSQLFNLAKARVSVKAEGFGISNSYGRMLTATSLTVDGQTIPLYSPASMPPAHGRPGGKAGHRASRGLGRSPAYRSPTPPAYSPPPAGGPNSAH